MKNRNLPLLILFAAFGASTNKLAELRQTKASKIKAQGDMIEARKASENGKFSDEDAKKFNALTEEIRSLDADIKEELEIEEAEKRSASLNGKPVDTGISNKGEEAEERKIKQHASVSRALRLVTRGAELDGAEKEMHELGILESKRAKVEVPENTKLQIPMSMLRATAQTVTEDGGAYGGALVHDAAPRVQMPFVPQSFLEKLGVTIWRNLSGGSIPLPVFGKYSMDWLGETEEIIVQKTTVAGPSISPKRLGGAVEISNRLLIQSSIDTENTVRNLIWQAYNESLNAAVINGSGAGNEPLGILNTPGIQVSTTTTQSVPTYPMAVELPSLLASSNVSEANLAYLLHPMLRALLQTVKIDAGSGQFIMPTKDELQGYKAISTTLMPTLAGNYPLIFGDWSKFFVGEWGSMSILSDPYSASLKDSIRLVLNAHAGMGVAQPSAFAVNKFLNAEAGV